MANGTDVIGRINVWAGDSTTLFAGADDISVRTAATAPVELVDFRAD